MIKSIILFINYIAESIWPFQKANKDDTNVIKYEEIQNLEEHIIESEPVKVIEDEKVKVEPFEEEKQYNSDDEIVIHNHIVRTFTVKAPYNGPSQIVLSEYQQLIRVYENGQYTVARLSSIEDYGTDEEDDFKIIYNIVVEP